jgi:hypothetical protein
MIFFWFSLLLESSKKYFRISALWALNNSRRRFFGFGGDMNVDWEVKKVDFAFDALLAIMEGQVIKIKELSEYKNAHINFSDSAKNILMTRIF